MTKNELQNITEKTKDRATRTPLKATCSRMVSSSWARCDDRRVTFKTRDHHL